MARQAGSPVEHRDLDDDLDGGDRRGTGLIDEVATEFGGVLELGLSGTNRFAVRAEEAIRSLPEPGSLDAIWINFSDPWPKTRHWKRRFISTDGLDRLARTDLTRSDRRGHPGRVERAERVVGEGTDPAGLVALADLLVGGRGVGLRRHLHDVTRRSRPGVVSPFAP